MKRFEDYDRFVSCVGWLAENFQHTLSAATLEIWWESLHDLTWEDYKGATLRILAEDKYWPKPGRVREMAREIRTARAAKETKERADREVKKGEVEDEIFRRNPILVQAGRDLFNQVWTLHSAGHPGGAGLKGCPACKHGVEHPKPWLHLRAVSCAADVDWAILVEGCCQ